MTNKRKLIYYIPNIGSIKAIKMNSHVKKIIPPLIVVLILILANIRIGKLLISADLPKGIIAIGLLIPVVITVVSIIVLIERIKEIKKGEEDDLGNY